MALPDDMSSTRRHGAVRIAVRAAGWTLLLVALVPPPALGQEAPLPSLEEALAASAAGELLEGRVPEPVARQAIASIDAGMRPTELRRVAHVAMAGDLVGPLVTRLIEVAAARPDALGLTALELVERLAPETLDGAVAPFRRRWIDALLALAASDDARGARALSLLARDAPPEVLLELLDRASNRQRLQLLRAVQSSRHPRQVLDALVRVELEPELFDPFCAAVGALVASDDGTAERALELAAQGTWGWGSALLRALGRAPEAARERAKVFVVQALETGSGYHLAAAVIAGTRLRMPELAVQLDDLTRLQESREVRVAAIRAIPVLRERDPRTIDLLIDLLSDPEVSKEAHRALLRQSGVRLPLHREPWVEWRRRELGEPDRPPSTPDRPSPTPSVTVVRDSSPEPRAERGDWSVGLLAVGVGACLAAYLGSRAGAAAARPRQVPAEHEAQPAQATHQELSRLATRLERLSSHLDHDAAVTASEENEAQLELLRAALRSAPPRDDEPQLAPPPVSPVLPPLEALREILRLGRGLELTGSSPSTPLEALQASVDRLEGSLPGSGFTELGRECCFLLLQVAYQLSRGRSVDAAIRERWVHVLEDIAGHLTRLEHEPHEDVRTLDVSEAFPDLSASSGNINETPSLDPGPSSLPAEQPTLDVALAFGGELSPSSSASGPTRTTPAEDDAPTLDVAEAFPGSPGRSDD